MLIDKDKTLLSLILLFFYNGSSAFTHGHRNFWEYLETASGSSSSIFIFHPSSASFALLLFFKLTFSTFSLFLSLYLALMKHVRCTWSGFFCFRSYFWTLNYSICSVCRSCMIVIYIAKWLLLSIVPFTLRVAIVEMSGESKLPFHWIRI